MPREATRKRRWTNSFSFSHPPLCTSSSSSLLSGENTWHVVLFRLHTNHQQQKKRRRPIECCRASGRGTFNRMCVSDFILILFEVNEKLFSGPERGTEWKRRREIPPDSKNTSTDSHTPSLLGASERKKLGTRFLWMNSLSRFRSYLSSFLCVFHSMSFTFIDALYYM